MTLRQTETDTLYSTQHPEDYATVHAHLRDYFRLDIDASELYKQWSLDPNFKAKTKRFNGVRILRQDPLENLISFICSSNNNIKRIALMIHGFCKRYGKLTGSIGSDDYYAFPTLDVLQHPSLEYELRTELGFGYRAKYIASAMRYIHGDKGGVEWLLHLRTLTYSETKAELLKIAGVGPKVADCVCLMSMDKLEAVPIDTHMIQIAERDYRIRIPTKSLTERSYNIIGDHFRAVFAVHAGWAHSVLFAADLASLQRIDEAESIKEETDIAVEVATKVEVVVKEQNVKLSFKVVKKRKIILAKTEEHVKSEFVSTLIKLEDVNFE